MRYGGDGRMSKSIWVHEPIITPELKLWRAVLIQANVEAELPLSLDGSEPMERTLARRFLRADGASEVQDLHRVCDFADVPADRVTLWARKCYPVEQTSKKHAERGSPAAAFTTGLLSNRETGSKDTVLHELVLSGSPVSA
jgi:hypothetical protein